MPIERLGCASADSARRGVLLIVHSWPSSPLRGGHGRSVASYHLSQDIMMVKRQLFSWKRDRRVVWEKGDEDRWPRCRHHIDASGWSDGLCQDFSKGGPVQPNEGVAVYECARCGVRWKGPAWYGPCVHQGKSTPRGSSCPTAPEPSGEATIESTHLQNGKG